MAEEAVKDVHGADSLPEEQEPVVDEQFAAEEAAGFQEETVQPEPEDWRVQAIKNDPSVRARFDEALFGQQEQAYEPAPDPVAEARQKLNEVESSMPQLDESNMTAEQVTAFMKWQQQRAEAQQAVYDVEIQQTRAEVMAQRARTQLDEYVEATREADPAFKDYETQFRQYVRDNNIDPRLLENRTIVEMIRKAIGYDHLSKRPKAKAPGAPPVDESYTSQGRAAKQARQQAAEEAMREPTELDHQLAAFYGLPVEQLIGQESELGADRENWNIKGAVQWSDKEKIRRLNRR